MQEFGEFLVEYWQIIVAAILSVISFIFCLIRKHPVSNLVDQELADVLSQIPYWIIEAEERFDDGKKKFAWVLSQCEKYMSKSGLDNTELALWLNLLSVHIENVLATPQKKVN